MTATDAAPLLGSCITDSNPHCPYKELANESHHTVFAICLYCHIQHEAQLEQAIAGPDALALKTQQ